MQEPWKSMTGFGTSRLEGELFVQVWEVRSVNSKYFDLKWRLPVQVRSAEFFLEKIVRTKAGRGRIDISLTLEKVEQAPGEAGPARFQVAEATRMLEEITQFAQTQGHSFTPDYNVFLGLSSLWPAPDSAWENGTEGSYADLAAGLQKALDDWDTSRIQEAKALLADLHARVDQMSAWLLAIENRAPTIKAERLVQVRDRLTTMLAALGGELEEGRFLQEAVILADKWDVSEEITRLAAHLQRFNELLENGGQNGRKLDFTLQECFREVNTCGNKIQDATLSRVVVDFKNELEKCREQVQNLE